MAEATYVDELTRAMQAIKDGDSEPEVSEEDATGADEETTETSKIDNSDEDTTEEDEAKEEPGVEESESEPEVEGPEDEEEEEESDDTGEDVLSELRERARKQERELALMRAKLERLSKKPKSSKKEESFFEDDDEDEDSEVEELSEIEQVQQNLMAIGQTRGPVLEQLADIMAANPKYQDLEEVCSKQNFDSVFEVVGNDIAVKEGIDPVLARLKVEQQVWSMRNPYQFMYELIKKNHPKYAEHEDKPEPKSKPKPKAKDKVTPEEPAKAPGSVADMGGKTSAGTKSWSAARIDEMDELELTTVPSDIWEQYQKGELE